MVNSGELGIIYISKVLISWGGLGVAYMNMLANVGPGVVMFTLIIHQSNLLCHIIVSLNVMSLVMAF